MTKFEAWKQGLTAEAAKRILDGLCLDEAMEICPARAYCDSCGGCRAAENERCEARFFAWANAAS